MDYTGVLSSATRLKKSSQYKIVIADYCHEILLQLNTAIMNAHTVGLSHIEYKLLMNFPQVDENVSNKEIQTSVYYNIITELEKKDYVVAITFHKEFTLLYVSWAVKAPMSELARMEEKIRSLASNRI